MLIYNGLSRAQGGKDEGGRIKDELGKKYLPYLCKERELFNAYQ